MVDILHEPSDDSSTSGPRPLPFGGEVHFERVFEDAAIGMGLASLDGRWLVVNRALCEITGYTEEQLTSMTFQAMTHPEDLDADLAQVERLLRGEIRSYQLEKRYIHARGHTVWILLSASLVRGPDGTPSHFIAQVQDITDRKTLVGRLEENEEWYRSALESMPDAFTILSAVRDEEGHIVDLRYEFINDAGCRLNERSKEEHIGHTVLELLPGHRGSDLFDKYRRVIETGEPLVEESLIHADEFGNRYLARAFDIRATKFYDGIAVTWRDVTQRKQDEIAKDEFVANAAHELRTPLSVISGYAITLGERAEKLTPEQFADGIDAMRRQGHKLTQMIGNLLDLSRIRGAHPTEDRRIRLSQMVAHLLARIPPPEGVRVESHVPEDLVCRTDPGSVDQILANLLINAYRYGGDLVTVTAKAHAHEVVIRVEDDGSGIEPSFVPRLFEPFSRATPHSGSAGSGLGLAIGWRLAKSLGGSLAYRPVKPTGSAFELRIPR